MSRRSRPLLIALLALSLSGCTGGPPAAEPPPSTPPSSAPADPGPPAATGEIPAPKQRTPEPAVPSPPTGEPTAPGPTANSYFDPSRTDVVVNKRRPLSPLDYAPAELRAPEVSTATDKALLRPDAASAVEDMFRAAAQEGVGLTLVSGYRSYADQEATYAHWVAVYGDAGQADTVSARPGYSEHQTGLAFDIGAADGACTLSGCFRDTRAAQWAAAHAAEFGVLLRYPLGASDITGFSAESWHFRFVGRDVAQAMQSGGTQTLEEHFGLPAAPSY